MEQSHDDGNEGNKEKNASEQVSSINFFLGTIFMTAKYKK